MSVGDAINHPFFDDIRPKYENFQTIAGKPFYFEVNDLTK